MNQYICYVAGKSGGHIIPALTHARNMVRENAMHRDAKHTDAELKILFFSTNSALDRSLLENNRLITVYQPLELGNVPRQNIFAWPRFIMQLMEIFWQTFRCLRHYRPVKVVSMGGYISVPVCCVAWLLRIPFEVYELNVVPGKAVQFLSKKAAVVHICFAQTKKYLPKKARCQVSPYPLRYSECDKVSRQVACEALGIDPRKNIICVLGGSQGSRFINELMQKYVIQNNDQDACVIIHQTGATDVQAVEDFYHKQGITALVFAYRNDIHICYAAADVIVARAGAGTLFEILFFQKPALIIPLETVSTDHQKDNALTMQAEHDKLFTVLLQGDIDKNPTRFFELLGSFLPKKSH